jgi:hypothetical protein
MQRTRPGEGSIGSLLYGASNAVRLQFTDSLREHGLDHDMWIMLQTIKMGGEAGADPVEAAQRMLMPKGALIDAAERLVRDGWAKPISRISAPSSRLVLTKKAAKALPALESTGAFLLQHATNGFTQEDIEAFAGYLKRVIDNMA